MSENICKSFVRKTNNPLRALAFTAAIILGFLGLAVNSTAGRTIPMPPTLGAALDPTMGQLGAPLEWFEIPGQAGEHHLTQKSRYGYLVLTPTECFFPRLGLTAAGRGIAPDSGDLNKGSSFAHVRGWDPGDVVEWGIWVTEPGDLVLRVRMSSNSDQGRFTISIGNRAREFVPTVSAPDEPALAQEFTCRIGESGRHIIRVTNMEKPSNDTLLHWVEVAGPAVKDALLLRKRWRPAAAHTRFLSSNVTTGARMWIIEMDAVPGELGFYAPITTPFGYYGPSWNSDGTVKSGMNFSLWSYGRKEKEPPVGELSHLLAIGNREAAFSGFGHEGTGVKIRNWEPLKGRQGQRQAFALRVEPSREFNTFYSYFYASDEKRWRLFGVGRQKSKRRPLTHLGVGSFVEVPGAASRQRTGSTVRRMRYRGWISQDGRSWQPLDTMKIGDVDKKTGLTYTDRGLDENGWFYLQTGGWIFRKPPGGHITGGGKTGELPEYLAPTAVQAMLELRSGIKAVRASRNGQTAILNYQIRELGENPKVFAYFGEKEGLTLAKKWSRRIELPFPVEGENEASIRLGTSRPVFLRLLLQNDHGQYWSFKTINIR